MEVSALDDNKKLTQEKLKCPIMKYQKTFF